MNVNMNRFGVIVVNKRMQADQSWTRASFYRANR